MPRLILVRHAQSENNLSNARIRERFAGDAARILLESERARQPDPELSELGRAQARALAEAFAGELRRERAVLVSSPMRRALQTATALIEQAEQATPGLFVCEGELFEVGGCYYGEEARPSLTAAQIEAEFGARCRGVDPEGWYAGRSRRESSSEANARVERIIAWAEAMLGGGEHDTVIVVAHGDLLSRWLRRWLGVPAGRGLAFVHGNTGVSSLTWDRVGGLLVEGVNELGHLPVRLRSGGDTDAWWRYARPGG
jgi:2,3-bisphosphoglycerate-dependent phosphoglycerate mutase